VGRELWRDWQVQVILRLDEVLSKALFFFVSWKGTIMIFTKLVFIGSSSGMAQKEL
jgi:hypothetical protein